MNVRLIVAAAIILGAIGCTQKPEAARHTVEEYRADKKLRKAVFKQCANDPGTLGETPDCINARQAERLESLGSMRESSQIGLDTFKKR